MRIRLAFLSFCSLALAVCSFGQTTPAPLPTEPPISRILFTATATGFSDNSGQHPASIGFMGLQITKTLSAGYENLTVSGEPVRAHFGVVGYSNTLNTFIGAKATSHLVFDASNVVVTLGGGFGKMIVGPTGTALTS